MMHCAAFGAYCSAQWTVFKTCDYGTSVVCNVQFHICKSSVYCTLHTTHSKLHSSHCTFYIAHSSVQWTLALPSVRGRGTWLGGIRGTATIRQQHKYCQDSDFDTHYDDDDDGDDGDNGVYDLGDGHYKTSQILPRF